MSTYYLDGHKLSAVERQMETSSERIARETRLASGRLVRDVIAIKRTWSIEYDWLPGDDDDVIDDGLGRDSIRGMYEDGGTYTFSVPRESDTEDEVTVMFGEYEEERIRTNPNYFWRVSFELVEQ